MPTSSAVKPLTTPPQQPSPLQFPTLVEAQKSPITQLVVQLPLQQANKSPVQTPLQPQQHVPATQPIVQSPLQQVNKNPVKTPLRTPPQKLSK